MTDKWGKLVEERLQAAFAEGKFADLPGKGKPLNLEEDPLADPALWMARHILRNSGMSLPWVEDRRRIEKLFAEAAAELAQAWSMNGACEKAEHLGSVAESRWQEAMAEYRERVFALNRRIRTYNLSVPHVRFQRCLIEAEREIAQVRRQKA